MPAIGKGLKATGLDKVIGLGFLGLAGAEAAKYAVINPLLERGGIKPPSYVPPPAMSQYEEIMLGQQQQPGFLGFGGQQRTQGLIERRANFDMDRQRNAQIMADRLARMQIENNSPVALTRTLADRDRFTAGQNALASISSAMANSMTGNQSIPTQIGYSQTGYAQQQPAYPNSMYEGQRGAGRRNRYGIDMSSSLPPGASMTPELREQMAYSSDQMGQFSGRGGAIARGYDSAKYGYVDNMTPTGAEDYALGGARRRRVRG